MADTQSCASTMSNFACPNDDLDEVVNNTCAMTMVSRRRRSTSLGGLKVEVFTLASLSKHWIVAGTTAMAVVTIGMPR